ncbi:MAG: hypothetical protein IJA61_03050 [Clostridia bacterium]|nr:hypothetical protein [Clostridia bacterium]
MNEKYKNIHKGHRLRIRERARKEGVKNFEPHQFLEYLLSFSVARKDTNPLAHILIQEFGDLDKVFRASYDDLLDIPGLGEVSATFIATFKDMVDYYQNYRAKKNIRVNGPADAVTVIKPLLDRQPTEVFAIVFLDAKDEMINYELLDNGTETEIEVNVDKVADLVRKHKARSVLIAHNHPTQYFNPSKDDLRITKVLYMALSLQGVQLKDHLIFTRDDIFSFKERGHMDKIINMVKNFNEMQIEERFTYDFSKKG